MSKHGGNRPGAGRPKSGRKSYCLRVKRAVWEAIARMAFERDKSYGEVVEEKFAPPAAGG